MRTSRRRPIEPPQAIARALAKGRRRGEKVTFDIVTLTPPSGKQKSWRLRASIKGGPIERSAKDENAQIYAAFLSLQQEVLKRSTTDGPAKSQEFLFETLSKYINQRGPKGEWKGKTPKNRRQDFNHLLRIAKEENLLNANLNAPLIHRFLQDATASAIRANTLLSVIHTFVSWGVGTGYFTNDQLTEISSVIWSPPEGIDYQRPLSRREQSKFHFGTADRLGGEIPTHDQVRDFASILQKHYQYGEGLVHTSANLGTRIGETLILTASKQAHAEGRGNYVDLEGRVAKIHWQIPSEEVTHKRPTKNRTFRSVVIPSVESIATGFDVFTWLKKRSKQALIEQKNGTNPDALIFPNHFGEAINYNSFYSSTLENVFARLGWTMPAYLDAKGKSHKMNRFTLHSLRDRFALTAADEWGYTERQLMEQGGWTNPRTIQMFYMGTTDRTLLEVLQKHRKKQKTQTKKRRKK